MFCISNKSGKLLRVPFHQNNNILSKYPVLISKKSSLYPVIVEKDKIFCSWMDKCNKPIPIFTLCDGSKILDNPSGLFSLTWCTDNDLKMNTNHPLLTEYKKCCETGVLCNDLIREYIGTVDSDANLVFELNDSKPDYILYPVINSTSNFICYDENVDTSKGIGIKKI